MTTVPDRRDPIRWYVYLRGYPGSDFYLLVPMPGHGTRAGAEAWATQAYGPVTPTSRPWVLSRPGWKGPVVLYPDRP